MNNDMGLYFKTLTNFDKRFTNIYQGIQDDLANDNYQSAERLIHTFKSLAGSIGAKNLEKISADLETAIHEKNENQISSQLESLMQIW
jgi:FOG: HPt domain